MARYPAARYNRRNGSRRWIYIIVTLIAFWLLFAWIFDFAPFSDENSEPQVAEPALQESEQSQKLEPVVIKPAPAPVTPAAQEPVQETLRVELPQATVPPAAEPNSVAAVQINHALELLNARPAKVIEARTTLNDLLVSVPMSQEQTVFVKAKLAELSDMWLFSRTIYPEDNLCGTYKVRPGDIFSNIGNKFNVPYGILMDINNIKNAGALRADETLKIINGPFHVRVYRSTFTMDLYLQDTYVRSFKVGLARPPHETPTGLWRVKSDGKLISPRWTDPDTGKTYEPYDPDYPLGSRWIGIEGLKGAAEGRTGFALHGTKDKDSIGKASSRGCIRLYNGDIVLMYKLLQAGVSQIEVVD